MSNIRKHFAPRAKWQLDSSNMSAPPWRCGRGFSTLTYKAPRRVAGMQDETCLHPTEKGHGLQQRQGPLRCPRRCTALPLDPASRPTTTAVYRVSSAGPENAKARRGCTSGGLSICAAFVLRGAALVTPSVLPAASEACNLLPQLPHQRRYLRSGYAPYLRRSVCGSRAIPLRVRQPRQATTAV